MKTLLIAIPALSLTACVTMDEIIQREGEKAGANQVQIDAVKHGCTSGRSAGGSIYDKFKKDYNLYKNDAEYKMRYDDAFIMCKSKYENAIRR